MIIKLINAVKAGGHMNPPGSTVEMDDAEAKRLVGLGAAEFLPESSPVSEDIEPDEMEDSNDKSDDVIDELTQLKGVNEDMAQRMIDAGINGIAQLLEMEPDALADLKISGIGIKKAEAIIADAQLNFE
jgi:predicted flap endonuclease-1-like 5' DNA nuclease